MPKKQLLTSCPQSRVVLIGTPIEIVGEQATRYLYAAPCNKWECPYCGMIKKAQWGMKIYYGVKYYNEYYWDFVTLTSHRKLTTFESTVAVWPDAWQKMSNRLRYEFKPEYALVPEKHKDGRLHVHLVIGNKKAHLTEEWLKKKAVKSGLGWKVDTQALRDPIGAGFYVTKYIGKSLQENAWPVKFRRVRVSQGWPEVPPRDDFEPLELDWKPLIDYSIEEVKANMEKQGKRVIVLGRDNGITTTD